MPRTWASFSTTSRIKEKVTVEEIDLLAIREWLGHLHAQRLTAVSMRRKLAAVRSFFKYLLREGVITTNVARLGAHAESSQVASCGDDRRTNQHAGGRRGSR